MMPHSGISGGIIMLKKSPFLNKFNSIDSEILSLDTNVAIIQETNKQLEGKLRSKLFNY